MENDDKKVAVEAIRTFINAYEDSQMYEHNSMNVAALLQLAAPIILSMTYNEALKIIALYELLPDSALKKE